MTEFTIILALILAVVVIMVVLHGNDKRLALEWRIAQLAARLEQLELRVREIVSPPQAAPDPVPARPAPISTPATAPAPPPPPVNMTPAPAAPAEPPPTFAAPPPPQQAAVAWLARVEEQLMRRWMIWLGALALALGLVFLVRYSIERGFFGPTARVLSGTVLGAVLLILGEWTRRHPPAISAASERLNYIPPGLTAAGIVGLFASFYAAYGLYDLLDPLVAFILLAAVAAGAALLAVLHGPFLALLGLGGAYVVPLLIKTPHPSLWGLLVYVLLVSAGSLFLVRWRGWLWLGWTVTIGTAFWGAIGAFTYFEGPADHGLPIGLFLSLSSAMLVCIIRHPREMSRPPIFIWTALAFSAVLMLAVVSDASHSTTSLVMSLVLGAVLCVLALRDPGFDRLAWLAAGLQVGIIAAWHFIPPQLGAPVESYLSVAPPPILSSYLGYAALIALGFGAGGFLALWRVPHPARWALLAAATPIAILAVTYWRAERLGVSFPWAVVALALAALNQAASESLRAHRADKERNAALAAFAVAMIASIALGLTMSLRTAWLSVALALMLPALVWVYDRTGVKAARVTALVTAAIVLVRLVLNPSIIDYAFGERPIFNGLLYTYGIPVAAFWLAARGFRRSANDALVAVLEGGTLALAVVFISLEIRHALHDGSIGDRGYGLLEQGLQSDAWLTVAYALLRRDVGPLHAVRAIAWRVLACVAAANLLLFPILLSNPLWSSESVGRLLFFDALLFAYGVPAIFAALFAFAFRRRGLDELADATGLIGVALGFAYLSLEVRHMFHGEILSFGTPSDFEWYVYSAVWLLYGLALMVTGMVYDRPKLRLAGLAIGAVVSAKVFLFDTATLSGLYRAASFLGLGASLIGLGYLYQRLAAPMRSAGSGSGQKQS